MHLTNEQRNIRTDFELGERVDAFVGRFGHLQHTLGGKLLPALLNERLSVSESKTANNS